MTAWRCFHHLRQNCMIIKVMSVCTLNNASFDIIATISGYSVIEVTAWNKCKCFWSCNHNRGYYRKITAPINFAMISRKCYTVQATLKSTTLFRWWPGIQAVSYDFSKGKQRPQAIWVSKVSFKDTNPKVPAKQVYCITLCPRVFTLILLKGMIYSTCQPVSI